MNVSIHRGARVFFFHFRWHLGDGSAVFQLHVLYCHISIVVSPYLVRDSNALPNKTSFEGISTVCENGMSIERLRFDMC